MNIKLVSVIFFLAFSPIGCGKYYQPLKKDLLLNYEKLENKKSTDVKYSSYVYYMFGDRHTQV